MLIHLFEKEFDDLIESFTLNDNEQYLLDSYQIPENAAKQLFKQFEGNECVAFVEALRDCCNKYLEDANNSHK